MLTEAQITELFYPQWDLVITQLEEGKEFSGNAIKAVGQFFVQMGSPQDHVDMMLAMLLSCPQSTQKEIIGYVAKNNQEKILQTLLAHLKEHQVEVKTAEDVSGWVQYFFIVALVSQITKIVEKMREMN